MVRINGENLDVVGKSVADYLDSAGYDRMRVAVELNSNIVPKAQYCDTIFKDGDNVGIIQIRFSVEGFTFLSACNTSSRFLFCFVYYITL